MKVLVAVASKHGSTYEIGAAIADELRSTGLLVDLAHVDTIKSLAPYDALVFGNAIYAGNWLPEAKRFAERFHVHVASMPVWVWSSGPLGSPNPQPHNNPERLAVALGNSAVRDHRIFAGKLNSDTLGFAERMIAKAFRAPSGDFRDWNVIRAWAQEIATTLTTGVSCSSAAG